MKNAILSLAIIAFMAGSTTTISSQELSESSIKIRQDSIDTNKDLAESKQYTKQEQKDSIAEFQQYKKESLATIKSNEESIAALKANASQVNEEEKADYSKSVANMEQKNTELKKELVDYKYKNQSAWKEFKTKFNKELDSLSNSIKDFKKNK